MISDLTSKYIEKTYRSYEMNREISKYIPGGVGSQVRWFDPYPFYMERGEGAWIWDIDGNAYIDYVMAWGPLLFGHARPKSVLEALKKQIDNGLVYGIPNTVKLEVAKLMRSMIPCAEKIKFCNTGTEAVMYAVRIARAYTRRRKILKFEGVFHGYSSDVWISVTPQLDRAGPYENPNPVPSAEGIIDDYTRSIIISHWNDIEHFRRKVRENKEDLAAVLIAPVNTGCGVLPPREGFLEEIREETEKHNILLIFDEVITGFRLSRGGAQEYYGVIPDIAVYGKILGGGLPIGAICGREEYMMVTDPKNPKSAIAGTFTTNPLTMVAAYAMLREIEVDSDLYLKLNSTTEKFIDKLRDVFTSKNINVFIGYVGSIFQIYFTEKEIRNYRDTVQINKNMYKTFFTSLLLKGVFTSHSPYGRWYTSTAHTWKEYDETIAKTEDILKDLKTMK
ncbi:MAG: aspartate aminotransferase family protein [Candidatus Methanomethylicia archaeon]